MSDETRPHLCHDVYCFIDRDGHLCHDGNCRANDIEIAERDAAASRFEYYVAESQRNGEDDRDAYGEYDTKHGSN